MNSIQYGNKRISFEIERGVREKTAAIHIRSQGMVFVSVPKDLDEKKIRVIVQRKAKWIIERQDWFKNNRHSLWPKEFVSGEAFPFLGKEYRLQVVRSTSEKAAQCEIIGRRLRVEVNKNLENEVQRRATKHAIRAWYLTRADEKLRERVSYFSPLLGTKPRSIETKDQKKRWGSCSRDGILRFNWKIVMASVSVLDYVVVHELCHLIHSHHSPRFWQKIQSVLPDYMRRRDRLRAFSVEKDLLT